MASPQKENGYTAIANELLDVLCQLHLSGNEWSYILAVLRKTYGFQKKEDWISNSQIVQMTGMRKERVSEAKRSLISKGIVTENRNKISLQKDHEKWAELRKTVTAVTENRNKSYGKPYTQKKKETITKEISKTDVLQLNEKDMAWKQYNENKHSDDLPVVDSESGEVVNPDAQEKSKNKELTQRKNKAIDWLIEYQGRDILRTNRPKQMKALNEILKMNVSLREAADMVKEQMVSDYWKGKQEKPDFSTVASIIQKRG